MTSATSTRVDSPRLKPDPGSFRDPAGGVILDGDERVFRYLTSDAAPQFDALMQSDLLDTLSSSGAAVETRKATAADEAAVRQIVPDAELVVEHARIPFISYVYEWPFEMLQAAAISHLETMTAALDRGFMLKDSTPFNIQFTGTRPTLIDVASLEPHREGAPWAGYSQFCRTFLNPLLFQSITGIPFQNWLRGSLDGIDPSDLSRILPLRHKLRPSVFTHVVLQAWLNRRLSKQTPTEAEAITREIPTSAILRMAEGLLGNVKRVRRRKDSQWSWAEYEGRLPYTPEALEAKERFVERSISLAEPKTVWDLGCNTGRFTLLAAKHADYVVAIDGEDAAVGSLYGRCRNSHPNILPLTIDLMNPSSDLGWNQEERPGLRARGPADFTLALALVHHLRISGNVPLDRIVAWLGDVSMAGVVEFVPKADPMVQALLGTRPDVYADYTQGGFERALDRHFSIQESFGLPDSERVLYRYLRR
jgi:ribosomal protein L11 methylase PrmA